MVKWSIQYRMIVAGYIYIILNGPTRLPQLIFSFQCETVILVFVGAEDRSVPHR